MSHVRCPCDSFVKHNEIFLFISCTIKVNSSSYNAVIVLHLLEASINSTSLTWYLLIHAQERKIMYYWILLKKLLLSTSGPLWQGFLSCLRIIIPSTFRYVIIYELWDPTSTDIPRDLKSRWCWLHIISHAQVEIFLHVRVFPTEILYEHRLGINLLLYLLFCLILDNHLW